MPNLKVASRRQDVRERDLTFPEPFGAARESLRAPGVWTVSTSGPDDGTLSRSGHNDMLGVPRSLRGTKGSIPVGV
jgi:hypothetical protein